MKNPIDSVQWVAAEKVRPNEYNPNYQLNESHDLLRSSIEQDGWTQPIVVRPANDEGVHIIVDGEHRWKVGVALGGKVPVVVLEQDQAGCIAATVRHNRARGSHGVESMIGLIKMMRAEGKGDKEIEVAFGMTAQERERLEISEDDFLKYMSGPDAMMSA